jgi:hypothetical protein
MLPNRRRGNFDTRRYCNACSCASLKPNQWLTSDAMSEALIVDPNCLDKDCSRHLLRSSKGRMAVLHGVRDDLLAVVKFLDIRPPVETTYHLESRVLPEIAFLPAIATRAGIAKGILIIAYSDAT